MYIYDFLHIYMFHHLTFMCIFDTIDHSILVHRLHADFGFSVTVLRGSSSYLTDRTQCVSLSSNCSAFAPVHSGVSQGTVLGPILLSMYSKPLSAIMFHTLSYPVHLLMTYNYRCLLPLIKCLSYLTLCSHV